MNSGGLVLQSVKCEVGRGKWGSNWVFSFRNWELGSKKWDVGLIGYNLISARGGGAGGDGSGGLDDSRDPRWVL